MAKSSYPTIKSFLNDFLNYCEIEKGLSATTSKNYYRFLQNFFTWLKKNNLESLKPDELAEEHIWKYRMYLSRLPNKTQKAKSGLQTSTQIRYLIALRTLLAYFHEKNISSLPTEKIKLPKEHHEKLIKFLDLEQIKKLLSSPDEKKPEGKRDKAILESLFSTGLRVAELASLDRKHLEGARNKPDFEISIIGKGSHPRTIYFSERALAAVKNYLNERGDDGIEALFISTRKNKPDNSDSARLSTRTIERVVQKYAKKASLSVLATPHTLRHSFATDLLNQGVDLRTVQEFLGHRNIATTQIYTHVTNKRLSEIHRKFHGGRDL